MSASPLPVALLASALALVACGSQAPDLDRAREAARAHDVRILRDSWGVPHVFGRTDADTAFGLAWAHAEDDFETIQLSLLAARGQLASVRGREAAPNDYLVGLLRLQDVLEAGYESQLSPRTRRLVESYAAGLDTYAALHPDEVLPGTLPFRGQDVVAGFLHKTPLFFGLHRTVAKLMQAEPETRPAAVGSNTFAVAPSRSADGHTRLAINSHQPWEGPVAWYEVHLHSDEGWDMAGGVFPGAPFVLHGHNRDLGWAFTVNLPDLVDVYELEIDPDDPDRYRLDGEWRRLESRRHPIRVKLWGPFHWTVERELLWSEHGPVIRGPRGTFAIRYAGWGALRVVEQWYAMNRARSFEEWKDAMRMGALPSLNAGYADREGNVFYVYNALLPDRAAGFDWSDTLPGDRSELIWSRFLPFDRLPQVENPPSGFVQNCNSTPFRTTQGAGNPDPRDFPARLGIETRMTNRALRALELLGSDPSITREEFEAYKFDVAYSEDSEEAAYLRQALAEPASEDPLLARARQVLAGWDLRTDPGNPGAALGVLTLRPLVERELSRGDGPLPPATESLLRAARWLTRYHGRLDVPWREVNRLRRGELELPLGGAPDVLRAIYAEEAQGRLAGMAGDSFVMLVEWDPAGRVSSRSIHQFGSATRDPSSPHYADQAPLFAARQLKPVWLDEAEIRAHLEREYRPGEELR